MIKNVLSGIGGIGIFGIVSLLLFIAVFSGAFIWALRLKRNFLEEMSSLPLHDGTPPTGPERKTTL